MKKRFVFAASALLVSLMVGCQNTSSLTSSSSSATSPSSTSSSSFIQGKEDVSFEDGTTVQFNYRSPVQNKGLNDKGLASYSQDGTILHAWNWSYNTIKDSLEDIAAAGYSTIQTSPVQQSKATSTTGSWSSSWSMLYQPVSFSIAETSWLGSKEDLKELCTEAEKYGIKIICDIVVNHMANDNTGKGYSERIEQYEPEIYQNKEKYFHQGGFQTNDSNVQNVVHGQLSNLPDLNTADEYVQERVKSLLKECIDVGVSGFRFDAAKHIETDADGEFASSFWENVLSSTTDYALTNYQKDMYYYGEILNTPGASRSFNDYTKYMSVTDTNVSDKVRSNVKVGLATYLANSLSYTFSEDGSKALLWAESHDTYADGSTKSITVDKINKMYAIEASRSGSTALYFARPEENTAMGEMGTTYWENNEVKAINNFHNKFLNADENISIQDQTFVNERHSANEDKTGVVLVKPGQSLVYEIKIKVRNMKDGTYYDQVSGNKFVVENNTLKGKLSDTGICVITEDIPLLAPVINVSSKTGYFYDDMNVKVTTQHADQVEYSFDGNTYTSLSSDGVVSLMGENEIKLFVKATNESETIIEQYSYFKIEKKTGYVACAGLKDPTSCEIYAWVWKTGGEGHWAEVLVQGNVAYVPISSEYDNYLLASFPKGYGFASLNNNSWADKIGQTSDYKIDENIIEISTI